MQRVFPSTLVLTDRDGKGKYLRSFLISSRMSTCTIYLALSSIYSHFCWSAHQVPFFLSLFLPNIYQVSGIGPWFLYWDPKECNLSKIQYRPGGLTAAQRHWSITWRSQSGSPRSTPHSTTQCTICSILSSPIQHFHHFWGINWAFILLRQKPSPQVWHTYFLLYNCYPLQ